MREIRAVPADFRTHAEESVRSLCARYGATTRTVERWRRETGVYIPRGAHLENGNARKDRERITREDPRAIAVCLSCTSARCPGWCERVSNIYLATL